MESLTLQKQYDVKIKFFSMLKEGRINRASLTGVILTEKGVTKGSYSAGWEWLPF